MRDNKSAAINSTRKEINMPKKTSNPNIQRPMHPAYGTPLFVYTGGGRDEVSTIATDFQGLKITPSQIVSVNRIVAATIQLVVECRVMDGCQLKARMGRTNEGSLPCLENTVVLTTNPNYETRFHMSGFGLPPGDHELCMEWCVSGGRVHSLSLFHRHPERLLGSRLFRPRDMLQIDSVPPSLGPIKVQNKSLGA
jgi:hypothetical protein